MIYLLQYDAMPHILLCLGYLHRNLVVPKAEEERENNASEIYDEEEYYVFLNTNDENICLVK